MLNPALYAQLQRLFPQGVKIANDDEPLVIGTRTDHNGEKRRWKEQSGETYRVCCPICGDERFRLSISYAWGLDSKEKYPTSKLVNCFNERCQEKFDEDAPDRGNVRLWLERRLRNSYMRQIQNGDITIKPVVKDRRVEKAVPFPQPDWVSPVNQLPEGHPAVRYLHGRKFDLDTLYLWWGCVVADQYPLSANGKSYDWLSGRIFIPTPGGWQARAVDDSKPKYFSCPGWKKSEHLYGINLARKYPDFTMLCEGVTDVWRVGGPAVAIFGKALSTAQVMKLKKNWSTVGVLLDPDTETDDVNSMRRAVNQLSQLGIKVFRVSLTGHKDAGDCEYGHLWDCIEKSADSAGFNFVRRPHA
jgi:hypothetical protein